MLAYMTIPNLHNNPLRRKSVVSFRASQSQATTKLRLAPHQVRRANGTLVAGSEDKAVKVPSWAACRNPVVRTHRNPWHPRADSGTARHQSRTVRATKLTGTPRRPLRPSRDVTWTCDFWVASPRLGKAFDDDDDVVVVVFFFLACV